MNASAIYTAVIDVKLTKPAPPGKKQATIRTTDDQTFFVWPKDLGRFQPGRRYRIEYTERAWEGQTYRTAIKAEPAATQPSAPMPSAASNATSETVADGEVQFVTTLLAASIHACAVDNNQGALRDRAKVLRSIYRDVFCS